MTSSNSASKQKKRKAVPLAPPAMKSRKKARQVTTQFHKLSRRRDAALQQGDQAQVATLDKAIEEMGGREQYQRASQVSTSFHSTSKWVIGYLVRNGWIYGIPEEQDIGESRCQKKRKKRPTRLLEIGAINTELLDAAKINETTLNGSADEITKPKHSNSLQVRAIDLNAMDERIEEIDFLEMKIAKEKENRYDVIVCSMVLNCVTTAERRGRMLCRIYHFLRPGGLCFLTIPKSCLTLSPCISREKFLTLLQTISFELVEFKESPKVSFFICRRSVNELPISEDKIAEWNALAVTPPPRWTKRYQTDFSVVLPKVSVDDRNLVYEY